jgi:hypothetical protein
MNGRRECDTSPCKTKTETNYEITEKMLLHQKQQIFLPEAHVVGVGDNFRGHRSYRVSQ